MNKNNKLFVSDENVKYHTLIIGTSGQGKSIHIQNSNNDNEKRMEINKTIELEKLAHEERLQSLKDTYWDMTLAMDSSLYELYPIYDSISEILNIQPTLKIQKIIFDMLPEDIFGLGISWGFGDTEVRDKIHNFVRNFEHSIKEKINNPNN